MRLAPRSRRPGMSLLEVLGATAIFLMAIVAIGELMSSSTDQALEVQHRSRATRLCQSKLNEFAAGVEPLSGSGSGTFEEEPDWSWSADVANESTAANLYRVTVTVSRDTGRGPVEVSMTQFIFDPLQRGYLDAGTPASSGADGGSASGSGSSGSGSSGSGSAGGSGAAAGAGSMTGAGTGAGGTRTGTGSAGGAGGTRTGGSTGSGGGASTGGGAKR